MDKFMEKYSFFITSLLGIVAVIVLVLGWDGMDMLKKLPIIYIMALAVHENEELKFPGGFVEMVTAMTGLKLKKLGLAKFGLLMFTLYATIIPTLISGYVWPVMATLFIGIIEIFGKAYISSQVADAICFAVLIVVLLVKPTGLFGKNIQEKV